MTPPPIPEQTIVAGITLDNGRYKVLRPLGEGGGGVVWLANHTKMNSLVAIKFPHKDVVGLNTRFAEEIKLHVKFSNQHPHYVSILDVGNIGSQPYIVMQYLANGCLSDRIAAQRQKDLSNASVNWLKATADALDYLHANGLVHRDVKPANILLDDSMSAYLSDFGIVKTAVIEKNSAFGFFQNERTSIAGSIPYLAPEILKSGAATFRSDQYALAISTYEFLTGHRPFSSTTISQLRSAQHAEIRPLSFYGQIFPKQLQAIVLRALSPNPENRFPTCNEFASEVMQYWLNIETIHNHPASEKIRFNNKPELPNSTDKSKAQVDLEMGSPTRCDNEPSSDSALNETPKTSQQRKIKFSRLNRPKRQ